MIPIATLEEALRIVEEYEGAASDFQLPIADSLLDASVMLNNQITTGLYMAIITDKILGKGFIPDGFEQKDGYRLYKYKDLSEIIMI
jgi:hypothetical protein